MKKSDIRRVRLRSQFLLMMPLILILVGCPFIDRQRAETGIAGGKKPVVAPVNEEALWPLRLYYVDAVNPAASDANPGTQGLPWLSIQHAADRAGTGDMVIVKAGVYDERISISRSGNAEHYIVFKAQGTARTRGFLLYGNYIAVSGFEIVDPGPDPLDPWLGGGFWLEGGWLYVADNHISDFTESTGIQGTWDPLTPAHHVHVRNNHIYRCNKGIEVAGHDWLVEKNEIERLYRGPAGGDADNFRFFGENHIIRENLMHGTLEAEIGVSHVDLFQTFNNNGEIAHDILFEKNIGLGFFHQGVMLSGNGQSHRNLIFERNVFVGGSAWGFCLYSGNGLHIINNTIYAIGYYGIGFNTDEGFTTRGVIKNNILAFCSTAYYCDSAPVWETGFNLIYHCQHLPDPKNHTDLINVDPKFRLYDKTENITLMDVLGPDGIAFTQDDGLNLRPGSAAYHTGELGANIGAY